MNSQFTYLFMVIATHHTRPAPLLHFALVLALTISSSSLLAQASRRALVRARERHDKIQSFGNALLHVKLMD
jgi:hypothetical protein